MSPFKSNRMMQVCNIISYLLSLTIINASLLALNSHFDDFHCTSDEDTESKQGVFDIHHSKYRLKYLQMHIAKIQSQKVTTVHINFHATKW